MAINCLLLRRPFPTAVLYINISRNTTHQNACNDPVTSLVCIVHGLAITFGVFFNVNWYLNAFSSVIALDFCRALAKQSLLEEDCTADLSGLSPEEEARLEEQIAKFDAQYDRVGRIVPPLELSLKQLAEFDGRDSGKPIYLALAGIIFNVTAGRQFYGPEGMYPFAGKECARALAKMSLDDKDCSGSIDDLSPGERETLKDWDSRFKEKYPQVGRIVD